MVGTTPVCEKVSGSSGTAGGVCKVVPDWSGWGIARSPKPIDQRRGEQAVKVEAPFAFAEGSLAEGRGDAAREGRGLGRGGVQASAGGDGGTGFVSWFRSWANAGADAPAPSASNV